MRSILLSVSLCFLIAVSGCSMESSTEGKQLQAGDAPQSQWEVHDMDRPAPDVITPGKAETVSAPSDAIVLFDGKDLSNWTAGDGSKTKWVLGEGYMESVKGSGPIVSSDKFGSCQLHIEFATPANVKGDSQGRGNSGVFLMSTYEIQVLDSFENRTYADGQCGALYGRNVPQVNSSRKPGQWQSYDIIFHRPIFDGNKVARKATFTVFHNDVLIHDHVVLQGGTGWMGPHAVSDYKAHDDKLPIQLQDHGNPVRFRNIWVRELQG